MKSSFKRLEICELILSTILIVKMVSNRSLFCRAEADDAFIHKNKYVTKQQRNK